LDFIKISTVVRIDFIEEACHHTFAGASVVVGIAFILPFILACFGP
jgi:hypothetical protein